MYSDASGLSATQTRLLLSQWQSAAETLMNRDGNDERFPNGGHRIKSDPLLIRAIEQIRDGYWDLVYTKSKLIKEKNRGAASEELSAKINDIDYDLIIWNNRSYDRLQKPNYGLSQEEVREISGEEKTVPGLSATDATKITGTVIRRSINALDVALKREGFFRCEVPHVPLKATPEAVGRRRITPKDTRESAGNARDGAVGSGTSSPYR